MIEFVKAMYQASYKGEATNAAQDMGRALVSKGDMIVVDSFLKDRPPPIVEDPQEEAEIRIGKKSQFSYDLSIGDSKKRADEIVNGPKFGGVTWPDPPPDDQPDEEDPQRDQVVIVDIYESERDIETIRVDGSDGESYVDIQRIKSITFRMPDKRGPSGNIFEFWRYHLNWENPNINGVDTSQLDLGTGDTVIDVRDA